MGMRISVADNCARITPSINSTMEWTIASGCIRIFIFSLETPNRNIASRSSRPLFIIVAESTLIFLPILHLGCRRTLLTDIAFNLLIPVSLKGPPEAVR